MTRRARIAACAVLPILLAAGLLVVRATHPLPVIPPRGTTLEGVAAGDPVESPIGSPVLWARVTLDRVSPDPAPIADRTLGTPRILLTGTAGGPVTLPDPSPAWPDRAFVRDLASTEGLKGGLPALHDPGARYAVTVTAIRPGQRLVVEPATGRLWFESRATIEYRAWLVRGQRKRIALFLTACALAELGCAAAWLRSGASGQG